MSLQENLPGVVPYWLEPSVVAVMTQHASPGHLQQPITTFTITFAKGTHSDILNLLRNTHMPIRS
jgi:hypothetical protein